MQGACPDCGGKISNGAIACEHCGARRVPSLSWQRLTLATLVLGAALGTYSHYSPSSHPDSDNEAQSWP